MCSKGCLLAKPATPTGGLFGGGASTGATTGLFGSSTVGTTPAGGGLFGNNASTGVGGGIFGASGTNASAAGSNPLFGGGTSASGSTNTFGGGFNTASSGLFGASKPAEQGTTVAPKPTTSNC